MTSIREQRTFVGMGLWCNGSTEPHQGCRYGFESRQVHSLDETRVGLIIELTLMGYRVSGMASTFEAVSFWRSIQKIRSIQRIPLRRLESRIANDAAQLFFSRAVGHASGADYVFFQHH